MLTGISTSVFIVNKQVMLMRRSRASSMGSGLALQHSMGSGLAMQHGSIRVSMGSGLALQHVHGVGSCVATWKPPRGSALESVIAS